MRISNSRLVAQSKRTLRPSQIKKLDGIVQSLMQNPFMGERGKEELENVWYLRYEDDYGRMLLCYEIRNTDLILLSLSRISVKI